mgnify:CR=1 FL=1
MKFCEKCGNILRVKRENGKNFLYCKPCDIRIELNEEITIATSGETEEKEIIVIEEDEKNVFPVTNIMCPKCETMREAFWTMQQTRGADEPPTRFYQCKTCNYRWREYS